MLNFHISPYLLTPLLVASLHLLVCLGDLNIAEPGALIGFAGPRVIKETIKKDLPEGFQRSEFILEHGFLDFIVPRKDLKEKIATVFRIIKELK